MIAISMSEAQILREAAHRVSSDEDYEPLLHLVGAAQFVLIGEASHGTQEFYATRASLTLSAKAEHTP